MHILRMPFFPKPFFLIILQMSGEFRRLGSDPLNYVSLVVNFYNDTGSNIQSVPRQVWDALTMGMVLPENANVSLAGGVVARSDVGALEMRVWLLDPIQTLLVDWIQVQCLIVDDPNAMMLSGIEMRDHLYFATAPGNHELFVSQKKNGVVDMLPVI